MNSYSKRRGPVKLACSTTGCTYTAEATTWRPARRLLSSHMAAGQHDLPTTKPPRKRKATPTPEVQPTVDPESGILDVFL